VGTRCADHVTPLYPQKLALTSPTGGGRSVGIVRVRTKATEFRVLVLVYAVYNEIVSVTDSGSVGPSPQHGAFSGCGWRNSQQFGPLFAELC